MYNADIHDTILQHQRDPKSFSFDQLANAHLSGLGSRNELGDHYANRALAKHRYLEMKHTY